MGFANPQSSLGEPITATAMAACATSSGCRDKIKGAWEKIKSGTQIVGGLLASVSNDYRKFSPINEPATVTRTTKLFSKASKFLNKQIGTLARGQNLTVISGSGTWYYVSIQGQKGYALSDAISLLGDEFDFVADVYGQKDNWSESNIKVAEAKYTLSLPSSWIVTDPPSGRGQFSPNTTFYQDISNGELIFISFDPYYGNVVDSGVYGQSSAAVEEIADIPQVKEEPTGSEFDFVEEVYGSREEWSEFRPASKSTVSPLLIGGAIAAAALLMK